jgi:23S rRNA pseudouridine2605 synthase
MITAGRVAVNGKRIDSPALNVGPKDRITVDGQPLPQAEPARLWLYHKPLGLVSTARDEQGRPTIFEALPEDMPRVMSVGRLDLNSEGLLLLTNDGGLKRKLELPSTGWVRKYRVRVNGEPSDTALAPLRAGVTVEGERFQPMSVQIDRQQGANAWLTIGIREGKNREIRRALAHVGLSVNRLIRVSYGPFQLGDLPRGAVEEIKARVLREQLGTDPKAESAPTGARLKPKAPKARAAGPVASTRDGAKPGGAARVAPGSFAARQEAARSGRPPVDAPARPARAGFAAKTRDDGAAKPARAPFKAGAPKAPARSGPAPTGPARSGPARTGPARSGPAKSGPPRSGPPKGPRTKG